MGAFSQSNMSQTAPTPSDGPGPDLESDRHKAAGRRLLEKLDGERGVCSNCFARTRRYYEGATEAQERHAEGTLLRTTAVSDPDPATFSEVVPPTNMPCDPGEDPLGRESRYRPARGRTVCTCGTIDSPETPGPRSSPERREAVVNVADRCREDDIGFDADAARAVLDAAAGRDGLQGDPTGLFRAAVGFGLSKA